MRYPRGYVNKASIYLASRMIAEQINSQNVVVFVKVIPQYEIHTGNPHCHPYEMRNVFINKQTIKQLNSHNKLELILIQHDNSHMLCFRCIVFTLPKRCSVHGDFPIPFYLSNIILSGVCVCVPYGTYINPVSRWAGRRSVRSVREATLNHAHAPSFGRNSSSSSI